MPELEFSVINFSRLCNDVEKLKTVFECQTLDCSLDNKRLLILSKPNSRFHVLYSENKMKSLTELNLKISVIKSLSGEAKIAVGNPEVKTT